MAKIGLGLVSALPHEQYHLIIARFLSLAIIRARVRQQNLRLAKPSTQSSLGLAF